MMQTVAYDESGWTGQDLLNPDSPVYTLASVNFTDEEAEELLSLISSVRAPEIKFKRAAHHKNLPGLTRLLSSDLVCMSNVKVAIHHKPYMVMTKIVDLLIEPLLHATGESLYLGDGQQKFANFWHFVMPVHIGHDKYQQILRNFVRLIRERTDGSIEDFYEFLSICQTDTLPPFANTLISMLGLTENIVDTALEGFEHTAIDPATPAFVMLSSMWSAQFETEFQVLHDPSKPLKHDKEIIDAITEQCQSTGLGIEYFNHGTMPCRLPLLVNLPIEFADSKKHKVLQVADVIAGAAAYHASMRVRGMSDTLSELIRTSNIPQVSASYIWPAPEFELTKRGEEQGGGAGFLNAIMKIMKPA